LLAELGEGELDLWIAYWQIEPFGYEWYRDATQCATTANFSMSGGKLKAEDFMPRRETKPLTTAQLQAKFLASVGLSGNRIVKAAEVTPSVDPINSELKLLGSVSTSPGVIENGDGMSGGNLRNEHCEQ
jgi:hypothetical protein